MTSQYDTRPVLHRNEVPYFNELMKYQESLKAEFLAFHENWYDESKEVTGLVLTRPPNGIDVEKYGSNPWLWKTSWFRYEFEPGGTVYTNHENLQYFPTVQKMLKELDGQLGIVMYSIIEGNTFLARHIGPENKAGEYLRIHIPLIVPEGDIFLEANGVETDFSDIFGFSNQYIHSSYNHSNFRRLVFLIDIRRDFLGLPPGEPWTEELENNPPPFMRNGIEYVSPLAQKN